MRAIWKWIVPVLTAAAFLTAMWYGINTYGWPGYTSTARALPGPWAYETDAGDAGLVRLPWTLALPSGTGQVALTAVLPEWEDEGYALHFKTMEQAVEVRVGGETRYTFGGSAGAKDFVYRAATHINEVPLTQADSGRDVAIILRSPPLFRTELGLLRAIWFGTQGDLVRHQFHDGLFTMLVSLSTLLITFSALLILLTYQGASLKQNLRLFLLAVLAVLFFNTENAALWPIFHHSPVLSSLLDWFFYILDPLLPLAAWMVLYTLGLRFRRWQKIWALGTGCAYIAATALSLFGAFPFNLTRPPFMVCSMAFTLALVLGRRGEDGALPALTVPVLILLLGYYLDYLKYVLMVLPFSARWSSFLQLELPFQFCTGVALTAFSLPRHAAPFPHSGFAAGAGEGGGGGALPRRARGHGDVSAGGSILRRPGGGSYHRLVRQLLFQSRRSLRRKGQYPAPAGGGPRRYMLYPVQRPAECPRGQRRRGKARRGASRPPKGERAAPPGEKPDASEERDPVPHHEEGEGPRSRACQHARRRPAPRRVSPRGGPGRRILGGHCALRRNPAGGVLTRAGFSVRRPRPRRAGGKRRAP